MCYVCRYRNFRPFTSPKPAQFSCVSVDSSRDFVAAGAYDVFDIFIWSIKTGRLLEVSYFLIRFVFPILL